MELELGPVEQEVLGEILSEYLKQLRSQIHHATSHRFKQSLMAREQVVEGLLARLSRSAPR
ncbi:MAG: hypothetical protein HYV62_13325 [Candidatus Rokubacteria bacterium]|nr:hypothetical protein [Candidatus Rokubacteria bacterium]